MGGVIILASVAVTSLIYVKDYPQIIPVLFLTVGFGLIGFLDDYLKVVMKRSDGLYPMQKMALQIVVTAIFAYYLVKVAKVPLTMIVPFTHGYELNLGCTEYPELAGHLSTAKSPQQMFGAIAKSYYAQKLGKSAKDIFCVSVMPCVAKKYEAATPEVSDVADQDVDVVLTTRELDRMLRAMQINVAALPEEDFDSPLGRGSGAGVIFGVTGGGMEAALRTAYWKLTGSNPPADAFQDIRGQKPWREASFSIGETTLRLAVASGLGSARALMDALRAGQVSYDFVEVMACPGGCSGGGGQPIHDGEDHAAQRGQRTDSFHAYHV